MYVSAVSSRMFTSTVCFLYCCVITLCTGRLLVNQAKSVLAMEEAVKNVNLKMKKHKDEVEMFSVIQKPTKAKHKMVLW